MATYERSIKIAFDRISGEVVEADEIFRNPKEAFATRRQFHMDEIELYCCECSQKLGVSTSKYDRLHFKHQMHAGPCVLKDENLSPAELEEFSQILRAKESPRHKELKKKIGDRLAAVEGVDVLSIFIDNKFVIRGEGKRRPDVYCVYKGKEFVFEIQLSQLSLRYILNRYEFYKKNGIYLIWILDNFDLHREKPSQLERDIKYLTKYENFFKLDESVEEFKFSCEYKFPFLTEENKLLTKWQTRSVGFDELHFDEIDYQAYYYNFGDNRTLQEVQQKRNAEAIRHAEQERLVKLDQEKRLRAERQYQAEQERLVKLDQEKRLRAEQQYQEQIEQAERIRLRGGMEKVNGIINWIGRLKKNNVQSYDNVAAEISRLSDEELKLFNTNSKIDKLDSAGNPSIHRWIEETTPQSFAFILFVLGETKIKVDVNSRNNQGLTVCQHLFKNDTAFKFSIMRLVLKRGYVFTEDDEIFFNALEKNLANEGTLLIYKICSSINDKQLIDWVLNNEKVIFILESARQNKIIGSALPNWIAFANNAIEYYGAYFECIERAFKHYGIWDRLIQNDKNGTFRKKLNGFYADFPKQNFEFEKVIEELYPEILSNSKVSI